ncbi:HAD family phosphatase [Flavihumibacter sp. CACIAM 22H1]|uniref:HAD family hydrolase n=1 Tax=Flavihumibacter sp. CACIAM 22H1 TaxID=1812911 RepID=UPI0007A8F86A|nr:HAD family phosphatase [Flavihumibacter sp. CACIAM 22H1]KYP13915.1 MAG: haloacid dehalogenase [Flavihumibacter sp. CACIAM 22H1]
MRTQVFSYDAWLFDLNGTMVDDMQYHVVAWSDMLNNVLGAGLSYEQVKAQMYGKNEELLVRVFGPDRFSSEEMLRYSMEKERRYQAAFLPRLQLIDGLASLLNAAQHAGIPMAIGSAANLFNIDFVLDNLQLRPYFKAIISAEDVAVSKPAPDTYLQCARALSVAPGRCLVFEDAPKGVEAAWKAGMDCLVLTTLHEKEEFSAYPNTIGFMNDYTGLLQAEQAPNK